MLENPAQGSTPHTGCGSNPRELPI